MSCYFKFNRTQIAVAESECRPEWPIKRADCNSRHERGAFWAWPLRLGLGGRSTLAPPCSHRHSARVAQGLLSSFVHGGRGWPNSQLDR